MISQLNQRYFITEDQLRELLGYVFHPTDETNDDAISLIVQKIRKQPIMHSSANESAEKVLEKLKKWVIENAEKIDAPPKWAGFPGGYVQPSDRVLGKIFELEERGKR